jgi:hypothetical protein
MTLPIDHIAIGAPSLETLCAWFEARSGVAPMKGGVHSGGLSHNALVALGPRCYLELYAPTGDAPSDDPWITMSRAAAAEPVVLGWCVAADGVLLDEVAATCRAIGVKGDGPFAMARTRPDGVTLNWRLFEPEPVGAALPLPFFIDWCGSPHPAASAPGGCGLLAVETTAPDPLAMADIFGRLGLDALPAVGPEGVRVRIATPRGPLSFQSSGS